VKTWKTPLALLGAPCAALILLLPASSDAILRSYALDESKPMTYAAQADALYVMVAEEEGNKIDTTVVVPMLMAIDKNLPVFFPSGPFTRNDFIAIAWVESDFNQMEYGTHGERGLFQIMPDEFRDWGVTDHFYGAKTNTRMAFRVLRGKYARWHDYKKAIIAYNGVVRRKNGAWSEKYWVAFKKRKDKVDAVLGGK